MSSQNGRSAVLDAPATAAKAKTVQDTKRIELPQLRIERAMITIVGDSPLIQHKWSEKAKRQMLDKQMKKAKGAKEAKDPYMDFCESLHWVTPMPKEPSETDIAAAKFGIPSVALKASAVDACSHVDGVTKVEARGAFHIDGEMIGISGSIPTMREDMVRIAMGTSDIRYRGEFKDWRAEFVIRYNVNVLSLGQIVNLFNTAGFAIGVGEWRPQKDGSFGMFHVAGAEE